MRAKPQLPYCITILLGIILFHHSLLAQLSPLPLEVGNYLIFDRVLNEERTSAVGRIEVTGKIRVTPVEQDTLYWHHSDGAFGPTGEEYFTLRFSGRTRLFPGPGLDTLLVRSDSQGNLWSRGFVNKGITRIAKEDQPWWLITGPETWSLRFNDTWWAIGFERWQDIQPKMFELGRRYDSSLSDSSDELIHIWGELNGILTVTSGAGIVSNVILLGVGPIWTYIPTDMSEYLGVHLELSEARIGDRVIRRFDETVVQQNSWGQIKAEQSWIGR